MDPTQCSVCGNHGAEYDCQRCEEPVCEDCTVVHTYHNQLEGTFCSNCYPDEPTMREIHERNKPKAKTMERLTELKVGMELPIAVLKAWVTEGKHYWSTTKSGWDQAIGDTVFGPQDKKIVSINRDHSFYVGGIKGLTDIDLWQKGFIEFYNNFYKLDQAMDIYNLENVHFEIPDKATQDRVLTRLFELGYTLNYGKELWNSYLKCWKIYTRKDIAGDSGASGTTLMDYNLLFSGKALNQVRTDFDKCSLICETPQEARDVIERLRSIGYGWIISESDFNSICNFAPIRVYSHEKAKDYSLGWDRNRNNSNIHYTTISVADILGTNSINTNNTPLNTQTDGRKIIVQKPVATVTRGERPEGARLSGKTRRATISRGYTGNRVSC